MITQPNPSNSETEKLEFQPIPPQDLIEPPPYDAFFSSENIITSDFTPSAPTLDEIPANPTSSQTLASDSPSSDQFTQSQAQKHAITNLSIAKQLLIPPYLTSIEALKQLDAFQLTIICLTFLITVFLTIYRVFSYACSRNQRHLARDRDVQGRRMDVLYSSLQKRAFNQYYETQYELSQLIYQRDHEKYEKHIASQIRESVQSASSWKFWKSSPKPSALAISTPTSKSALYPPKPKPPSYADDVKLFQFSTHELNALNALPFEYPLQQYQDEFQPEADSSKSTSSSSSSPTAASSKSPPSSSASSRARLSSSSSPLTWSKLTSSWVSREEKQPKPEPKSTSPIVSFFVLCAILYFPYFLYHNPTTGMLIIIIALIIFILTLVVFITALASEIAVPFCRRTPRQAART